MTDLRAQASRGGVWHRVSAIGDAICGLALGPPWVCVAMQCDLPDDAVACGACGLATVLREGGQGDDDAGE